MRITFYSIVITSFLLLFYSCSKEKGVDTIKSESLFNTTSKLAISDFNGRLAGSEGYNKAAQYVAEYFKSIGLKAMGDDGYFQYLDVEYNKINDLSFSLISDKGANLQYKPGKDFVCRGFSGSGNIEAPVVFCGYGISRPEMGYDDYKDIYVKDKIVMLFKSDPRWKIDGKAIGYNSLRKKARIAKEHGSKGIIYISFPNAKNPQKPIGSVMHGEGQHLPNMPQVHVSLNIAKKLARNSKHTLKEIQTFIDENKQPMSVSLNSKAHIAVDAEYEKNKETMNVVGLLEGNDEKLKDEYIVLGAHLDHVGNQGGAVLFPGANDNASGVASIMNVAKALASKKNELKRSVIFVAFTSEEQGLQGSTYFTNNSPVKMKKITAMLNMDCVAHGDSIVLGGGKSFPELHQLGRKMDSLDQHFVIDRTWRGGGADATPFFEQGVPTMYFATKNSYTHLHLPSDTPETLNKSLHTHITKLAYRTTLNIAKGKYSREANKTN